MDVVPWSWCTPHFMSLALKDAFGMGTKDTNREAKAVWEDVKKNADRVNKTKLKV